MLRTTFVIANGPLAQMLHSDEEDKPSPKSDPCWIITQIETLNICPSILKSTLVKRNRPYFL